MLLTLFANQPAESEVLPFVRRTTVIQTGYGSKHAKRAAAALVVLFFTPSAGDVYSRIQDEALVTTDDAQSARLYSRIRDDALATADEAQRIRRYVRVLQDAPEVSDAFTRLVFQAGGIRVRVQDDVLEITDALDRRLTLPRTATDGTGATADNIVRGLSRFRSAADSIVLSDSLLRSLRAVRVFFDSIELADNSISVRLNRRLFAELIDATDDDIAVLIQSASALFSALAVLGVENVSDTGIEVDWQLGAY